MAVTAAHLTTNSSTANANSYTTASITPAANNLVLVGVCVTVGASPTPAITVTGCGLTWVQVEQTVAGARTVHVFRGMGASPTAGALTIAGTGLTSCLWSVVQYGGVDTSGTNGSGAVAQSFNSKPANTNNLSVAFPATPTAGNGGFGLVGIAVQELPTAGSGWTAGGSTSQSAPTSGLIGEYATSCPANVTASWTTSAAPFVIGVEVKAAGGGPTAATASGSITLGGTATVAVSSVVDDFTTDAGRWTLITGAAITGGQLVLPTTTGYSGAATVSQFSLVESAAYAQSVQYGGTATSIAHFYMDAGGNSDVRFQITGGLVWATYKVAGSETWLSSAAYTPGMWLRLSESGGVITWATSTDGTTWTTLSTWTLAGFSVALIRPTFYSGYDGTGVAPANSLFDNVNVPPATTAATASGAVTLAGTVTGQARPTAAGTLTLGGTVTAPAVAASATGTVTLSGTGTPSARPTAAGTVTLGGSSTAAARPTAAGAITLGGAATATQPSSTAAGSITLAGTATARAVVTASGALTLSGASTARAAAIVTGTITLNGAVTARAAATASGALTLAGAGTLSALGNAAGLITLGGLASGIDAADTYHPHVYVTATLTGDGVSTAVLAASAGTAVLQGDARFGTAGFGASPFGGWQATGTATVPFAPSTATLASDGTSTATLASNGASTATLTEVPALAELQLV